MGRIRKTEMPQRVGEQNVAEVVSAAGDRDWEAPEQREAQANGQKPDEEHGCELRAVVPQWQEPE